MSNPFIGSVQVVDYYDTKNRSIRLKCRCERCGREYIAYKKHLIDGHNKLCQTCSAGKDPIDMRSGTWVVDKIERDTYLCVCRVCGKRQAVKKADFKSIDTCECQNTNQYNDVEDFFEKFSL